jgi:hypothetical protein
MNIGHTLEGDEVGAFVGRFVGGVTFANLELFVAFEAVGCDDAF